jgi:predicted flap endonuclease-1-like 5' DNA nuclease
MISLDTRRPPADAKEKDPQDSLVGEAQARELLGGIGRTLLRQLAHDGVIRSCKIARRRLYSRRAITKYISDRLRAEVDDGR